MLFLGGLDGSLCTHLCVEPNHVLLGDGGVDTLSEGHNVVLAGPDPEAAHEAAESYGADGETDELESCDTHGVEEGVLGRLRGIGGKGELC